MEMVLKEVEPGIWVSDEGHVFREMKFHWRGGGTKYPFVAFGAKKHDVHRLVAKAFIPNPENKPFVCHKDDDTTNNRADNLWWGTPLENMQDMALKGRDWGTRLSRILGLVSAGLTQREIASEIGVTESRVSQILSKHRQRMKRRKNRSSIVLQDLDFS